MEQQKTQASRLFAVALLVAAVFAGPALQVLAASDWNLPHGRTGSLLLTILNSYPFGFFLVAITAYTFAINPPSTVKDLRRALVAILCAVVVQLILLLLSWGLLFGIGESTSPVTGLTTLATVYALVIGTVHRFILHSRIPWWLELPAHAAAGGLSLLILNYVAPGIDSAPRLQLFGAWPALIVLAPYALLVAAYAPRGTNLRSAGFAVLFATALPYGVKAVADWRLGRAMPLAWPYRVVTQFETPFSASDRTNRHLLQLRAGKAFDVGGVHFRIAQGLQSVQTQDGTPDSPITGFQAMVPATRLGLDAQFEAARFLPLSIFLAGAGKPMLPSNEHYLNGRVGQLAWSLQRSGAKSKASDEEIRKRVEDVIQSSFVER